MALAQLQAPRGVRECPGSARPTAEWTRAISQSLRARFSGWHSGATDQW
ncbi:MAG: hypothetical protein M3P41_12060 [Actinomycetota bacterium]|nr:hypothetical protein [Actinomycetota bacterium]